MLSKNSTRYYSNRQEQRIAKAIGGKQVSNSGATVFNKGDVSSELFLIEAKTKIKESSSITIQKEWFKKLKEEAFAMRKSFSALVFDFGDSDMHYIINEELFKYLVNCLEDNYKELGQL